MRDSCIRRKNSGWVSWLEMFDWYDGRWRYFTRPDSYDPWLIS